jgi:hypothetical protein
MNGQYQDNERSPAWDDRMIYQVWTMGWGCVSYARTLTPAHCYHSGPCNCRHDTYYHYLRQPLTVRMQRKEI